MSPESTSVVLNAPTSVPCAEFSAIVEPLSTTSVGVLRIAPVVVVPRFPTPSSPTQNACLPSTDATSIVTVNDPGVVTVPVSPLDFTVEGVTVAPTVSITQYTVPASSVDPVTVAVEPSWAPATPVKLGAVASGGTRSVIIMCPVHYTPRAHAAQPSYRTRIQPQTSWTLDCGNHPGPRMQQTWCRRWTHQSH